ncbi:hypothetical protein KVV02_008827 [Mortierella alpina]|uniref:Major facilitator superfamily (MFS) profile domain-containing protein n=1 Tax=Mortierella alpina TaxID=64518 RepID=A0A9P8A6Z7_MORAP|nr:hypothetical protein KVV02_008827 [Mortierella alpina]
MKSCSPKTAVEGARSVDSINIDLGDTLQIQEKLPQYEQPNQSKLDGVRKDQDQDDCSAKETPDIPCVALDVQEFANGHASGGRAEGILENGVQYYPEGGHGWPVLVATFIAAFWCLGVTFCWGVFQEHFLRTNPFPGADARHLSWVGSLSCASVFAAAPAIVIMIQKMGAWTVLALGIISATSGFIGASFATAFWHLYITIGLLFGSGGCLVYFTSITVLAQYFNRRRGVVVGIAISGSGIGASVMAPVLRYLLSQLDFRWTMRILGGCMFVCLSLAACLVRPFNQTPSALTIRTQPDLGVVDLTPSSTSAAQRVDPSCNNSTGTNNSSLKTIRSRTGTEDEHRRPLSRNDSMAHSPSVSTVPTASSPTDDTANSLDFALFQSISYTLIFVGTNLFALVYLVPLLLAPSYATSIGLTAAQGATMISISSAVGIVSRIIIGYISDRYGVLNSTVVCCFISGLACLLLWLQAQSYALLATFMVFYGCFAGSSIMLFPVAATRAVPASRVSSALGFVFFAHTIGYLLGTPLAQFIIQVQHGGYAGAIVFVGIANLICGVIVLIARIAADPRLWVAI